MTGEGLLCCMTFGIFVVFRTCADVVAGVVTKCLNARAKTKEGGISVCLMYVEIEQQAVVQVWPLSILSVHPIDTCISRAVMPYPAQLSITYHFLIVQVFKL